MVVEAPICKVCNQTLTGLDAVFSDSGAGVVVTKCPRCHCLSHHLDTQRINCFAKQAGMADELKQALVQIGPAVAALGVWDVAVAYDTFKKVLRNTLRLQDRQMSPGYNPFYASGAAVEESYEGEEGHRQHIREVVQGTYLEPVAESLMREQDAFSVAAGLYHYLNHYHGGMSSEEYRMLSKLEYSPGMGEKDLGEDLPEGDESEQDLTAYRAFEAAGKAARGTTASLTKKADDWADNYAIKPREEIEHTTNPAPRHFQDDEDSQEVKVALSQVQDFLQKIIPHVVAYALEKQDGEVLQALGHLGTVIREARKAWRMAYEIEEQQYNKTYLANSGADVEQMSQ